MTLKKTRSITMKPVGRFSSIWGVALALATFIGLSTNSRAEVKQNTAVVRSVRGTGGGPGTAQYTAAGESGWKKLTVGTRLKQGATIKTAQGSIVDLFLGENGPVVRVTEDTIMGVDKLTRDNTGQETVIETQLDLRNGRILGNVKKLAAASKYEVKTPVGVAGIRGTQYDISANGRVTVIEGTVVVVYLVPGGGTQIVTVREGETAYPPTANSPARVEKTPAGYENPVWTFINPEPVTVLPVLVPVIDPKRSQQESTLNHPQ
jgi:hypothetical protein